jgi:hypothetical protein
MPSRARAATIACGPVVCDPAAAVDVDDLDPLRGVEGLTERQLRRRGAPAAGVHRRVLQQQQGVGDLVGLARFAQAQLQRERLCVGDEPEVANP